MKNLSTLFGKDQLDEIVFAHRNKAYGAYALRSEYSSHLTKAVFIGVAFFASLSVVPLVISALSNKEIIETVSTTGPTILDNVDDFNVVKQPPKTQASVKTVESPIVTPVREIKKIKPLPTDDDKKNAAVSSETSPGPETTLVVAPPTVVAGPPSVPAPFVPPAKVEDPNKLITQGEADVAADFKGGINAFRDKVAQNFDTESVDKSGMISGVITFIVEKDGSISNLKITGANADFNAEAERTVKSIKSKWTPAQLKGKAVRSSFRMPISMKIE